MNGLLARLFPPIEIQDECSPGAGLLMLRYKLIQTRWGGLYLHHFLRSDNDRAFHDHPWSYCTLLLSGGYYEHTPAGVYWRRRWSLLRRPATWQHWVEIPRPVWTLIWVSRRVREWGFITPKGWIHWRTFVGRRCE